MKHTYNGKKWVWLWKGYGYGRFLRMLQLKLVYECLIDPECFSNEAVSILRFFEGDFLLSTSTMVNHH